MSTAKKLVSVILIVAVGATTFAVAGAVIGGGGQQAAQASHRKVCIRIHRLRWCFGTQRRPVVKLARSVKAAYRADKVRRLTIAASVRAYRDTWNLKSGTLDCTQTAPGAYSCQPAP